MELSSTFVLIVLALVAFIVWYNLTSPLNFWKRRNVPYINPLISIVGLVDVIVKPFGQLIMDLYNTFPNEKFFGIVSFNQPILVVRDAELIETILIRDFSSIYNRNNIIDVDTNPLSRHLLNYTDELWKSLRNKLTPTFTSGKLKGMHPQVMNCVDSFKKYLSHYEMSDSIEIKELCGRYSMDVVSSCVFGLDLDIMNHPDSKFLEIGKKLLAPSRVLRTFFLLQPRLAPIFKKLKIEIFPKSLSEFFIHAIKETLAYREKSGIHRPDYLHLLSELKKKDDELVEKKELAPHDKGRFDETSILSNAFVFFAAGFETTTTALSYAFYELAVNQDVQEMLYKEVIDAAEKNGGELSFQAINDMEYLDHILSETLRIHPPAVALDRKITKDYQLPGTDIVLPKGTTIMVPVYGLHHDPQYFPDPKKFNPERFNPEKNSIVKGSYLPFGAGPRMCIAARFAKMEIKTCIASTIRNYKIHRCNDTKVPMEYEPRSLVLSPKGGIHVSFEKRTH